MAEKDVWNTIIVSQEPRGRTMDGIISGTPKPGTVMQIKPATARVHGLWTFEVYNRDADGDRPIGGIWVLLEKRIVGAGVDTAYASGETGHLYAPMMGDELLMLLADVAGTGDDHTIGELLIVDDGTGKLIVTTGTPEQEPFTCLETITDPTADTLALCMYNG